MKSLGGQLLLLKKIHDGSSNTSIAIPDGFQMRKRLRLQAEYQHCGVLRFRPEKGDDGEMESRILTVDIGFKGITVYGHPLAAPVQQHRPGGKAVVQSKTSGSRSPSSASNRHAGHKRQPSSIEMSAVREGRTERSLELSSSRTAITQSRPAQSTIGNDGLVSVGDRLGEEPLLCVRTVRKILIEKHQTALEADRPVEAGMCLRAIERLDEAEAKIVRLRSQVRDALSVGETQEADRPVEAGMCLRAIERLDEAEAKIVRLRSQVRDALSVGETQELRAVGIISKWATE
ncbi:unnamed protein product [Toxocara canis]|uniref:Uncharacterized protein n=1 Tax=Toxocara canis TaxID=6265 RepID=A0A183VBD2_TOXCA|nr:unnamed protein product [Toxocara canis]